MRSSNRCRRLSVVVSSVALAVISYQAFAAQHSHIDRVVAFGTSLTDTGNAFI